MLEKNKYTQLPRGTLSKTSGDEELPRDSQPQTTCSSGSGQGSQRTSMEMEMVATNVYPHLMTANEVMAFFGTDSAGGLAREGVEKNRRLYGENSLPDKPSKSLFALIIEQFEDLLVRILLGAAVISFVLALFESGDLSAFVEPAVILLILIANAIVSIWQENNAEQSLEALKRLQPDTALVKRDGEWKQLAASDLVPGDLVQIKVGDKCPADLRVTHIHTTTLKTEQSQLTGETHSVCKTSEAMELHNMVCELQLKNNMVFSTTTVSHGRADCVVVATGSSTEIGKIQAAVVEAEKDEEPSPLQIKLDEFGSQLSKVIGIICIVVWLINYRHFFTPSHGSALKGCIYYFKIAVALAVAAIPEGLPAVITTCLALGTMRMAKRNAIVRKLQSVETLGCTTVICSDKTGTLTTNEMTAVHFAVVNEEENLSHYGVEGHSFNPVGKIALLDNYMNPVANFDHVSSSNSTMQMFVRTCSMCNDSKLEIKEGRVSRIGEPTEAALKVLVEKLGCPDRSVNMKYLNQSLLDMSGNVQRPVEAFSEFWKRDARKLATLEFDRVRKSMSVLVKLEGDSNVKLLCKGAPESVMERCAYLLTPEGKTVPMTNEHRTKFFMAAEAMSKRALRTLAVAVRLAVLELAGYDGSASHPKASLLAETDNFYRLENEMVFIGLVGLLDPPRPEILESVKQCSEAGIRVMMITGDNKLTAEAIGSMCGITRGECVSLTGREFEELTEGEQRQVLATCEGAVFSRTEPRHKQMIVKLLRSLDEVVAMTGDGVNDAPALKQADIGISMGLSGTEVAKEASCMILADDNFSTIVAAVEEGRSIFNNMKAFIRYLISSNIGEVASIFLTAALGVPEGLAPVQLLWVNLVTDGLPATALGFNPPDLDVMRKGPRRKDESLISGWVMFRYFVIGAYVGLATVGILMYYYLFDMANSDNHSLLTYRQLSNFELCHQWSNFEVNKIYNMETSCDYFDQGKAKASTLSLTVLVVIEMLNAFNALSEDYSLFTLPPTANPFLCLAAGASILLHCLILYVPFLASIFNTVPLTLHDWLVVLLFSVPVIFIDEILKFVARNPGAFNLKRSTFSLFYRLKSPRSFFVKDR